AAALGRVVRLDLTAAAFEGGSAALRPEWQARLGQVLALLDKEPSVLRLAYAEAGGSTKLARQRLKAVRRHIADEWRSLGGRYRLEIETRIHTERPPRAARNRMPVYK
ncbi:hypothetical protein NUU27_25140, partial [Nitratireductor sp. ZSWI3]|nr:hypothetical protein [Nitratireductor sp. ZSWI3]